MRPIRTALRWQLIATAILTLIAATVWGGDGALSAALGGAINVVAGWAYGLIVSRRKAQSAGEALRTMFRAEAVKVLLIVVSLWLAMTYYRAIVHAAFLGSFVVTVAVFAAAIAVRDREEHKSPRASGQP